MTATLATPGYCWRFAEPRDSASLVPLINVAFLPEQVAIAGERINHETLQPYFANGRFLVLEDSNGLVGCVYAEIRNKRGYIGLLALRPELKGRGLGRVLMERAEAYLGGAGCEAVDLRTISARDDLVPMYKHLGYEQTGTEEMPAGVNLKIPCHFVVMSKILSEPRSES